MVNKVTACQSWAFDDSCSGIAVWAFFFGAGHCTSIAPDGAVAAFWKRHGIA